MSDYLYVAVLGAAGILFVAGGLITSRLFAYRSKDQGQKREPYECSEEVIGDARIQFHVSYYLYALVFLIFDIESLFLFPCMRIFRDVKEGLVQNISVTLLFVEILVFILILFMGLIYAWKKGVFEWD